MRYIYACFKNYIGFYNGLGLEKLEIDFSKSRNNIILISGINGCGKSTLMSSLNPFPDSSSSYVPSKDAEKILTLIDGSDTYHIRITSPCDVKGNRKVTKAFISKNGLELNENGNISSYKEIIFSEFELDSNFASLSRLSSTDRGLGDKTPSERKKFASSIVDNLETYNSMYKTLNKKSLIFKSHINNLHTKIQNIGMKDNLEVSLNSLKNKEEELNGKIVNLNNQIISIQTKYSINQEEALQIKKVKDDYSRVESIIESLKNKLALLSHKTHIEQDKIESKYNSDKELYSAYNSKINELKSLWQDKSNRASSDNDSIVSLEAKLSSYENSLDNQLEKKYNESCNKLGVINSSLRGVGIESNTELIFPLMNVLSFYQKFISQIENFYNDITQDHLDYIIYHYDPNMIDNIHKQLDETFILIDKAKSDSENIRQKMNKISVLSDRPKECKIDKCPFISDALEVKKLLGKMDIEQELSKLLELQMSLSKRVTELNEKIDFYHFCNSKHSEYDEIIRGIYENSSNLSLFHSYLVDIDKLNKMIYNMNSFNELKDPRKLIDGLNLLKELESEQKINSEFKISYDAYKDKLNLIDSQKDLLNKLMDSRSNLLREISDLRNEISNYESLKETLKSNLDTESEYISIYNQFLENKSILDSLQNELNKIEKKSSEALESINIIQGYQTTINSLKSELEPVKKDISYITGQLTLLESYYNEYNMYNEKYNMIETIKKYCNPTKGGIQTLFMQLYMGDTMRLSNEVLGLIFKGQYSLLPLEINETEFRIPFIGSGLPVDDISSGSNSQICMMGMIINLVLLYQASTKFNIANLDEIDLGLDSRNRLEFTKVLHSVVSILHIEQLFIISHSVELDSSNTDIIRLKTYEDFDNNQTNIGNIIYDYSKE